MPILFPNKPCPKCGYKNIDIFRDLFEQFFKMPIANENISYDSVNLESNEELKACNYCGNKIKALAKKCRFCNNWIKEDNNIQCPNCSELIISTAIKCKHCKTFINKTKSKSKIVIPNNKTLIICSILSLLILLYSIFLFIPTTPEYTIYKSIESLQEHDIESLKEYVNIEEITDSYLNEKIKNETNKIYVALDSLFRVQIKDIAMRKIEDAVDNPEKYNIDINNIDLNQLALLLILKKVDNIELQFTEKKRYLYEVKFTNSSDNLNITLKLKKDKNTGKFTIVYIYSEELIKKFLG
jgi:hypothetical protein